MAQQGNDGSSRSEKISDTAKPMKNKMSGVEILDEIKSHKFVYVMPFEDARGFTKMLHTLRCNETFTDVSVCVKNEVFPCHRLVLAASSTYFRALFQYDKEKSTSESLTLNGISPSGFQHLLGYMYTNELTIDLENILDVLEVADFLQFRPVVEKCSSILLQHITITNCLALRQIAESHLCRALADATFKFILRNFEEICQTEEFLHLEQSSLLSYIKDEHLQIKDEAKLLESICKWMAFDINSRKTALWELIQHTDLPKVNRYKLHEITSADERIKELFKDITREHVETDETSLALLKSSLKKRSTEVLV